MKIVFSLEEIDGVAQKILNTKPKKVILFYANMGVGKTTLIKALAKNLGVNGNTSSPTFSLINEYKISGHNLIYHFDMYRLKNESEAFDLGIEDYLYSGNWCFIEWAEKIPSSIPQDFTTINLKTLSNGKRELEIH